MHVVVVDELVLSKTQGLQVRCALANAFIIIKPSSNAPQDFASWPHKADTIIVKIVSLIDSREKNGRLDSMLFFVLLANHLQSGAKSGGATDF